MEKHVQQTAETLLDDGNVVELYELLTPYLEKNDPYAQFLYSSFSLESTGETEDEFEVRSMALLVKASEGGVAEASYRLGVIYLYGDFVANTSNSSGNSNSSGDYFERAISQGHSHSKFTYGFNLYYGVGDTAQDKIRGVKLMEEAAREGVTLAAEELKLIHSKT